MASGGSGGGDEFVGQRLHGQHRRAEAAAMVGAKAAAATREGGGAGMRDLPGVGRRDALWGRHVAAARCGGEEGIWGRMRVRER